MNFILNSDFGYTLSAAILTSIGLGTNSLPKMIGGMLISPMANPIIRMVDSGNITSNIIQLIILILTCIVIGMIYFNYFNYFMSNGVFEPTEKMKQMGNIKVNDYWNDIIYGLVIGITIYGAHETLNLSSSNVIAGFAIGVTILPAFVNAGIMFGAVLDDSYNKKENTNIYVYGISSFYIGLIYLITVLIGLYGSMKVDQYYHQL